MKRDDAIYLAQKRANESQTNFVVSRSNNGQWMYESEVHYQNIANKRFDPILIQSGIPTYVRTAEERISRTLWIDRYQDGWSAFDHLGQRILGTASQVKDHSFALAHEYGIKHGIICVALVLDSADSIMKQKIKERADALQCN